MILALIASAYILAGGILAALLIGGENRARSSTVPFAPAPAFALVVGMILIWPVLLALAADRGARR